MYPKRRLRRLGLSVPPLAGLAARLAPMEGNRDRNFIGTIAPASLRILRWRERLRIEVFNA
jgi:hypothetical protein